MLKTFKPKPSFNLSVNYSFTERLCQPTTFTQPKDLHVGDGQAVDIVKMKSTQVRLGSREDALLCNALEKETSTLRPVRNPLGN